MTTAPEPDAVPPAAGRRPPRRRWRRQLAFWLAAAVLTSAALALLIPASPLYFPHLLVAEASYEGRRVRSWLEQLKSDDREARAQAIFALGAIGPGAEEAVPALTTILQQDDDD